MAAFAEEDMKLLTFCCSGGSYSVYDLHGLESIPKPDAATIALNKAPPDDLSIAKVVYDKDNIPVTAGRRPVIRQMNIMQKKLSWK